MHLPEHHTFSRRDLDYIVPVSNPLAIQVGRTLQEPYRPLPISRHRKSFSYLMLYVTAKCNFACKYCFESDCLARPQANMSLETAQRAVELLFAGDEKDVAIGFFGGEPLTRWTLIENVVSYAERLASTRAKTISFAIFTNGFLLEQSHVEFFKRHSFTVFLSIDGPEEIHNEIRPLRDGTASYQRVAQSARLLLQAMPLQTVALTVIDPQQTRASLARIVDSLTQLGFLFVGLETPWAEPGSEFALDANSTQRLKNEFAELADMFLDGLLRGRVNWFDQRQFGLPLRRLLKLEAGAPLDVYSYCRAGTEMLAVSGDGALYPCQSFVGMEQFKLGHVASGGVSNISLRDQFIRYSSETTASCQACWARFLCGYARCPYDSYLSAGDCWLPNPHRCELERHIVELGLYIYHSVKRHNPKMFDVLSQLQGNRTPRFDSQSK